MSDEFELLDRVLRQLAQVLEAPGDERGVSAETSWQKLDVMYKTMGPDALRALLRRQGVDRTAADEALAVLERRHGQTP